MKAVLQYRASPGLRQRIAALDFPTVIVDEADKDTFLREMGNADILLHCWNRSRPRSSMPRPASG